MRTIKLYRVGILKSGKSYFEQEEVEVAFENNQWIVLNDDVLTRLTKNQTYASTSDRIGYHKIWDKNEERGFFKDHKYYGNGIFYKLYSETNKRPQTIKKEIAKFIEEKFGYLGTIDLSFIK